MKTLALAIIGASVLVACVIIFSGQKSETRVSPASYNNVSVIDGKQIVEVGVKGGYSPKSSVAKADAPTLLRLKTNGTFDCSSGVRIPSLGIDKTLPATGVTDIEIPAQKAGTIVQGLCSMGMYKFQVAFN